MMKKQIKVILAATAALFGIVVLGLAWGGEVDGKWRPTGAQGDDITQCFNWSSNSVAVCTGSCRHTWEWECTEESQIESECVPGFFGDDNKYIEGAGVACEVVPGTGYANDCGCPSSF